MRRETEAGNEKRETRNVGSPPTEATLAVSRFPFPVFRKFARAVRQIFGMPDYDRYVEHRRVCHPGEPVLSRREYFAQQVERRYAGGPNRCC